MSDLSDLEDAYGQDPRRQTLVKGKSGPKVNRVLCEAIGVFGGRCQNKVSAVRDGRRVCKVHKRVDWPLQYIEEAKQ